MRETTNTGLDGRVLLWGTLASILIGLVAYSQTRAGVADGGFHLVAAQLILAGKRPYLDFFFAQTPLNAYWNALWMRLIGEHWRTATGLAAVETAIAVFLASDYVLRSFPVANWRLPAAVSAAVLTGLTDVVFEFGVVAQAYGICLLLNVVAFRLAVAAVRRNSLFAVGLAGIASGASAASSLLAVTVAPVLLIWLMLNNRAGRKGLTFILFTAGAAIAFLPMIVFFVQSPRLVGFDVIGFHLFFRASGISSPWPTLSRVLTAWLVSAHALILGVLALAGFAHVRTSGWSSAARAELTLCAWLSLSSLGYLALTNPPIERYFVLTVPFLAILATVGLYVVSASFRTDNAWMPVWFIIILILPGLLRSLHHDRSRTWPEIERVARKVAEVTPGTGLLFANEPVYFVLGVIPPSGLEWRGTYKISLPAPEAARFHAMPLAERVREVGAGRFDTVEVCLPADVKTFALDSLYRRRTEVAGCSVFWDRDDK